MPRKKIEPILEPETGSKRIRTTTVEERVVPADEDPELATETEDEDDPFAPFKDCITIGAPARIHVWHLPNYERDGRMSANGAERIFCAVVPYDPEDDMLPQRVKDVGAPEGGTHVMELRIGGKVQGMGLIKLRPNPIQPGQPQQNGTQQHIHLPAPASLPAQSQMEIVTAQFDMVEKVVDLAKKLMPPPPNITVGDTNGNGNNQRDERTFEEKILETVVVKAFESPDKSSGVLDKVLDALGGRSHKEPGFLEGMAPLIGPALAELAKAAVPLIQSYAARQVAALQQPSQAPAQIAATATAPPNPFPIPDGAPQPERPPVPPIDPVERAWLRVVVRMLEDCEEQVRLAQVSTDKFPVEAAAASVIDVYDRFHDELAPIIDSVLGADPVEVFNLVQVILPPHVHGHVQALQQQKAAIEWVGELQTRVKEILAQAEEEGGEDGAAE